MVEVEGREGNGIVQGGLCPHLGIFLTSLGRTEASGRDSLAITPENPLVGFLLLFLVWRFQSQGGPFLQGPQGCSH